MKQNSKTNPQIVSSILSKVVFLALLSSLPCLAEGKTDSENIRDIQVPFGGLNVNEYLQSARNAFNEKVVIPLVEKRNKAEKEYDDKITPVVAPFNAQIKPYRDSITAIDSQIQVLEGWKASLGRQPMTPDHAIRYKADMASLKAQKSQTEREISQLESSRDAQVRQFNKDNATLVTRLQQLNKLTYAPKDRTPGPLFQLDQKILAAQHKWLNGPKGIDPRTGVEQYDSMMAFFHDALNTSCIANRVATKLGGYPLPRDPNSLQLNQQWQAARKKKAPWSQSGENVTDLDVNLLFDQIMMKGMEELKSPKEMRFKQQNAQGQQPSSDAQATSPKSASTRNQGKSKPKPEPATKKVEKPVASAPDDTFQPAATSASGESPLPMPAPGRRTDSVVDPTKSGMD